MPLPRSTDEQLLDRLARGDDAAAFPALVARHGPAVLRVCRAVLRDVHDAEDAFQVTFLTLFRKAGDLREPEAVRGWLCGVAYKTASRMRSRSLRRRQRELVLGPDPAAGSRGDRADDRLLDREIFPLVREELERLPEKYRSPLILCYFEGLTHDQAARHLGWAQGTVKVRLVRGRKMLRERLDRRKIALGIGLVALWRREAAAAPPDTLVRETIRRGVGAGPVGTGRNLGRVLHASRMAWALAFLIGLIWGLSEITAIRARRLGPPPALTNLPANLIDVLAVDCR